MLALACPLQAQPAPIVVPECEGLKIGILDLNDLSEAAGVPRCSLSDVSHLHTTLPPSPCHCPAIHSLKVAGDDSLPPCLADICFRGEARCDSVKGMCDQPP